MEVLKEVETCAYATGKDIHAVTLMLMYEFAEPIDGVTVLVRRGSGKNCSQLWNTAFPLGAVRLGVWADTGHYR